MAPLTNVSLTSLTTALKLIDTTFSFQTTPFHQILPHALWNNCSRLGFKHKTVLRIRVKYSVMAVVSSLLRLLLPTSFSWMVPG